MNATPETDAKPGEPCEHRGCLSHVSKPCEGCGRIAGEGHYFASHFLSSPWDTPEGFKCITFNPSAQAAIPPEIRAKMDANRKQAVAEMDAKTRTLVDRRKKLCQAVPSCPRCSESKQVQLKDWLVVPAVWRCRSCGHKFTEF